MISFFDDLARRIDLRWIKVNRREELFPSICVEELNKTPPHLHVSLDDLLGLALRLERLPRQIDFGSDFGQPPVTLYANDRFYISALFWLDSTTSMHEHSFSGAFHVLHGGSLHTRFEFSETESINDHMRLGVLTESNVEVLQRGATREIGTAGATIHSLFHLEHPSVSLVIRTHRSSVFRPQYDYFRPGIAFNDDYEKVELSRRRDLMTVLHHAAPERVPNACMDWLEVADFPSAFVILSHCLRLLTPEEGDALLERVYAKQPRIAGLAEQMVANERRETFIIQRRAVAKDAEVRFLLAVLLNVRGREASLRLIAQRFPDVPPRDTMIRLLHELAKLPGYNERRGEKSALGFAMDPVVETVLYELLGGASNPAIVTALEARLKRSLVADEPAQIADLAEALQQSELFRYLFND